MIKSHLLSVYVHPDRRTGAARAPSQPHSLAGVGDWGGAPAGVFAQGPFYDNDAFSRPDRGLKFRQEWARSQ